MPTWLTGVAALVALVFAAVAAHSGRDASRSAREALNLELKRDQSCAEQAIRDAQASSVAAWYERKADDAIYVEPWRAYHAVVLNGSALPIFEVGITFIYEPLQEERTTVTVPVIPPGQRIVDWPWELRMNDVESPTEFVVNLRFRDTRGNCWIRDIEGILHRD